MWRPTRADVERRLHRLAGHFYPRSHKVVRYHVDLRRYLTLTGKERRGHRYSLRW